MKVAHLPSACAEVRVHLPCLVTRKKKPDIAVESAQSNGKDISIALGYLGAALRRAC